MTELTDVEVRDALDVARQLVAAGVPLFVAPPDDTKATGFRLPDRWQTSTPTLDVVNRWRPGWALCAVMGHALDLVDVDPRNGGDASVGGLKAAGAWPRSYAKAATPSGGWHEFVAPLGAGSHDNIAAGIDVKGGLPDGTSRGFAFISPTARTSKTTGQREPYRWLTPPILDALTEGDDSGEHLADLVRSARRSPTKASDTSGDPFDQVASSPWEDIAGTLAKYTRHDAVVKLASALRGRGGWRHGDALAYMRAVVWPRLDQHRGDPPHPYTMAELEFDVRDVFTRYPDGPSTRADVDRPPLVDEGAGLVPVPARRVDLGPWLDGSYSPPQPSVGALRDDGVRLLYPGRWHNCDGLTEAGKSWAAIAHARDEMLNAERSVVYVHFEEELPGGTVSRLLSIGLPPDVIRKRFVWLSNDRPWTAAEMTAELSAVDSLGLLVLDGKNAACDRHGKDPGVTETVGWFRRTFVTPGARAGAAVLSLGHPVKATDRRDERHGYGSTAWLDYLDGAAFRLEPSRDHPIRKGASGTASLYVVKDRYGEVSRRCAPDGREGWRYAGSLVVDDSGISGGTSIRISAPAQDDPASGRAPDVIDKLAEEIVAALAEAEEHRYSSNRGLLELLRAQGVKFDDRDLAPALIRLEAAGRLERVPVAGSRPRPGWLTAVNQDQEEE